MLRTTFLSIMATALFTIAVALQALAQNPVIAKFRGAPITLDSIQDAQLAPIRQQLYTQFRARVRLHVLSQLNQEHPADYPILPITVTDEEIKAHYERSGAVAYGTLDTMKEQIRNYLHWTKSEQQLAVLWAKAIKAGLVQDLLEAPAPFTPRIPIAKYGLQGNPSADIVLIEFTDFQCPYCRQASPAVEQLVREQGDRFAFQVYQLPLDIHPGALESAVASECAARQNASASFNHELFELPPEKTRTKIFVEIAQRMKLKPDNFRQCLLDPATTTQVQIAAQQAMTLGITGTPSFMIGRRDRATQLLTGEIISGAVEYMALSNALAKLTR